MFNAIHQTWRYSGVAPAARSARRRIQVTGLSAGQSHPQKRVSHLTMRSIASHAWLTRLWSSARLSSCRSGLFRNAGNRGREEKPGDSSSQPSRLDAMLWLPPAFGSGQVCPWWKPEDAGGGTSGGREVLEDARCLLRLRAGFSSLLARKSSMAEDFHASISRCCARASTRPLTNVHSRLGSTADSGVSCVACAGSPTSSLSLASHKFEVPLAVHATSFRC